MPEMKVLLDCDPGLDDALALLLAHGDPAIDLVGVTTVGGNVSLAATTRNALQLRDYLGFTSVPISAGAVGPLERVAIDAAHVHGEEGLGAVRLAAAVTPVSGIPAVDLIVDILRSTPGEVHLVATGPLTNIALALRREPRIAEWAASFTIMGGSFSAGNATALAEFNIFADPEAAEVVFAGGWTVTMIGLDLTHQAVVTHEVVERMSGLGSLGSDLVVPLSTFWVDTDDGDWVGQSVHDVCAVAFVARPDLFESRAAHVEVDVTAGPGAGRTIFDFDSQHPNAVVPVVLDVAAFWDYVYGAYSNVAAEIDAR